MPLSWEDTAWHLCPMEAPLFGNAPHRVSWPGHPALRSEPIFFHQATVVQWGAHGLLWVHGVHVLQYEVRQPILGR